MIVSIATGCLLMVLTTAVHAAAMSLLLWWLRWIQAERWGSRSAVTRVTLVCTAVIVLFLASIIEVSIWTATYLAVGAISGLEPALYFSMVTFTSLGYGDVILPHTWRLLGSFEAANGIIMFGWTTALIFLVVQRLYFSPKR